MSSAPAPAPGPRQRLLQAAAAHRAGQLDTARSVYEELLAEDARNFDALHLLGVIANQQGRHAQAVELIERALSLKPDDPGANHNLATTHAMLGHVEAVLAAEERAVAARPAFAEAHYNRARALALLNRPAEAAAAYGAAIDAQPTYPEAHWNRALALLAAGDYERGWPLYEWRWRNPSTAHHRRELAQPLWLGVEDIEGRTLLVHDEQGLGDTIQFCRYLPLLAGRGARVIAEVAAPLVRLLSSLDGVHEVVARGTPLPAFDLQCPLLSLPLAFGTTLETIPSTFPYLRADPERVAHWRRRLGPRHAPRLGLVWRGASRRELELARLLPWLPSGIEYVCLQKDVSPQERVAAPHLVFVGDELTDFAETAALAEAVDAVVSVDTGVAHLAGALGRPTWLLLPFSADWRWLTGRTDSPWYPSFELLRQSSRDDWHGALSQLRAKLEAWARSAIS
ncbi:tetratricopeptide repeat protein [Ramlibacter sp.]|uniref:tetratricopeptide repeat protein n=1 Tax=Ramlibacter sp. TaxID=1917967 RepID=UPI003D13C703